MTDPSDNVERTPSPAEGPDGPGARRAAVVVAGHTSDAPTVFAALDDADPTVRSSALGALARLVRHGGADAAALDLALVAALSDEDVGVRRRAAGVAARSSVGAPVAVALTASLADTDPTVVEVAAFACGELTSPDRSVVMALVGVATSHEDSLCREAAVAALGSLGDPLGRDAVLAALEDRATVRRRAVLALAAFDGDEVSAALRRSTEDRDLQVRQAAEELLAIERGELPEARTRIGRPRGAGRSVRSGCGRSVRIRTRQAVGLALVVGDRGLLGPAGARALHDPEAPRGATGRRRRRCSP